jgi:hypothetical protein
MIGRAGEFALLDQLPRLDVFILKSPDAGDAAVERDRIVDSDDKQHSKAQKVSLEECDASRIFEVHCLLHRRLGQAKREIGQRVAFRCDACDGMTIEGEEIEMMARSKSNVALSHQPGVGAVGPGSRQTR